MNYHAYLPGLALFGWSGKWDSLPAVHFTTVLFDLLAILGLGAVGLRFGGMRLAALLAFAWAANPFTQYAVQLQHERRDHARLPDLGVLGRVFRRRSGRLRGARGLGQARGARRRSALGDVPGPSDWRRTALFAGGFTATTLLAFWALILGGDPVEAFRSFYERTFELQLDRRSPFSLWDWGQYHADGIPDLKWVQEVLQVRLVIAAVAVAFVPRRKSPLQLAALTAALLMGFELVLTHWAALYIAWFFPFLALAVVAGPELGGVVPARSTDGGGSAARA